jgi:DNA-binding NtrC family response regulator
VLECGTFYRLGSVRPRSVDVRVLAATNQDLQKLVAEGRFRADLYYRLKVGSLRLAPLRDRSADIPLLARHFLARIAQSRRQPAQVLAAEVARALQGYAWPGNVRQLLHELEAACVRARGTQLAVAHLSGDVRVSLAGPFHSRRGALLKEFERREIEAGLVRVGWNVTALAKQMGVGRRTLIAKIARLQIVRPPRQSPPAAPARAGSRFSPRQHMLPD